MEGAIVRFVVVLFLLLFTKNIWNYKNQFDCIYVFMVVGGGFPVFFEASCAVYLELEFGSK